MGEILLMGWSAFVSLVSFSFIIWLAYVISREVHIQEEIDLVEGQEKILLFDGVCNFCNTFVNIVLDYDQEAQIKFAALQSDVGGTLLETHGIPNDLTTVVFIENQQAFVRSTAALRVMKSLSFPWNALYYGAIWIPVPVRDMGYRIIGSNRYTLFGTSDECRVPTPEIEDRFLASS